MSTGKLPFEPGTSFFLPEILTQLPVGCHPNLAAVEEHSAAWVRRNLAFAFPSEERLQRFLKARCAYFGCILWPGTRDEYMLDLANLCQYLFAFDDAYGDRSGIGRDKETAQRVFDDLLSVMANTLPASCHPYAIPFHELWVRIALRMTPRQRARYSRAVADWLVGCAHEIESRQSGMVFDFDKYMAVRRDTVWSTPCFPLIEHGLGIELPEELIASADLEALHLLVTDCMILINDLYSFPKEVAEGDYVNAVPVLCIQEQLELQPAIGRICGFLQASEAQFVAQGRALLDRHPELHVDLSSYVTALAYYMTGLLRWARMTTRYPGAPSNQCS